VTQLVTGIAAVGEDVAQPGEAGADLGQDVGRAVAILDIGRMDQGGDQQTAGVGEDVALAALDLLARVIPARPAAFSGFDALAVNHSGARRGLAPRRLPAGHQQQMIDRGPKAAVAPGVEIALNRRHWREVSWQHPPGLPATQNVQQGVGDRPQRPLRRPSKARPRRDQRFQNRPFLVRQIA
jgi:hypothetical protein